MKQTQILTFLFTLLQVLVRVYGAEWNDNTTVSSSPENFTDHECQGHGQLKFLEEFWRSAFGVVNNLLNQRRSSDSKRDIEPEVALYSQGECILDLVEYSGALHNRSAWALKMADSTGRIGRGLLKGNFDLPGDPDECLRVKEELPDGHVIEANTCTVYLTIPDIVFKKADIPQNLLNSDWIPTEFTWHVCVPKSCPEENITETLNTVLHKDLRVSRVYCKEEKDTDIDTSSLVAICIIGLVLLLNVIGTFYDVITTPKTPQNWLARYAHELEKKASLERGFAYEHDLKPPVETGERKGLCHRILISFSVVQNTKKIFSTSSTQSNRYESYNWNQRSPEKLGILTSDWLKESQLKDNQSKNDDLSCIHGIRVISMSCIVLGHTILTLAFGVRNRLDVFRSLGSLPMQAVVNNGYLAVDTFFLLSGCLASFLFLQEKDKNGHLRCGQMVNYFLHRWLRLTPLYMAVIAVSVGLSDVFSGTRDDVITSACNNCKRNWWVNLLYINNVYRNTPEDICLGQSWFLSADMQFHWVAPLALVPLATGWTFIGFLVVSAFVSTHIITTTVFMYKSGGNMLLNSTEHQSMYYFMPYCRVGVFAIGILLGYLLHTRKSTFLKSKVRVAIGWTLSVAAIITCSVITTGQWSEGVDTWSTWERAAHEIISRPVWAVAVSWVIYACCLGAGGCLNSVLCWRVWRPLGRLSYGVFLLHIAVLTVSWTQTQTTLYFSALTVIQGFVFAWVISYGLAYVFSVLFEAPCIALEKIVTRKDK